MASQHRHQLGPRLIKLAGTYFVHDGLGNVQDYDNLLSALNRCNVLASPPPCYDVSEQKQAFVDAMMSAGRAA